MPRAVIYPYRLGGVSTIDETNTYVPFGGPFPGTTQPRGPDPCPADEITPQ